MGMEGVEGLHVISTTHAIEIKRKQFVVFLTSKTFIILENTEILYILD